MTCELKSFFLTKKFFQNKTKQDVDENVKLYAPKLFTSDEINVK